MGVIGDYFGWAVGLTTIDGGRSIGSLAVMAFFVAVVPALAVLCGLTAIVWIMAGVKTMGGEFIGGYRNGKNAPR